MPLIALPVIGVRGGGFDEARGESIDRLLEVCRDFDSANSPIDVAIVTPDAATYGALQHHRRRHADEIFDADQLALAKSLGDRASKGTLALFIGAGISMPAGSPSWSGLLESLTRDLAGDRTRKLSEEWQDPRWSESFHDLSFLDQAQLLSDAMGGSNALAKAVKKQTEGKSPALGHALLAGVNFREAVTTNYDNLYEVGCAAAGSNVAVLPRDPASGDQSWLLKLHGDLDQLDSILLTRRQFVTFPSLSGPSGAILQSLLLTRHLLVLGTSMNDDNVLRLVHEVAEYRRRNEVDPEIEDRVDYEADERTALGTILDVSAEPARRALHKRHFIWHTMTGDDDDERARNLEILLDALGVFAGTNDWWLLDPRFAKLHQAGDQRIVSEASSFVRRDPRASLGRTDLGPVATSARRHRCRASRGGG